MELNYQQLKWLSEHGDRIIDDLRADDYGLYVEMSDGNGGIEKVYMPKD